MRRKPSPKHQMDRIDNNGNYEPGNCRWAAPIEHANNIRTNHLLTIDGGTQTIVAWAREANILPGVLWSLIRRCWHTDWILMPVPRDDVLGV